MFQKVKRIIGFIILAALLFTAFYLSYIRINDKPPALFGYRLLRVSSESMEPALDVGELIIIKNVAPEMLEKGDVISYKAEKGYLKGSLVTHQISKEPYEKDGVYYFTTRGIKPESVDDPEISENQVIGEVLYKVPFVGTVYDFFTNWYGMILLAALLAILFADDIVSLYKKFTQNKFIDDDSDHKNTEDLYQSEVAMTERLNEFEGIITNLDDPDL